MPGKMFITKLKSFLFGNAFFVLAAAAVFVIGSGGPGSIGMAQGETPSYSIVFETSKNKLAIGSIKPTGYSGSGTAITELGNQVAFDYSLLVNPTANWQTILANGYITNTQPINGMESITLTKYSSAAHLKIYWSNTTTFSEDRSVLFDTSSAMTISTDFGGYLPNYIKILAIANSAILSGSIDFSCSNNYPTLSLNTNSSSLGLVTGSGIFEIGESVTINATPVNSGSYFVGWYDGETLISSNASYTFNMPFEDTSYVAHFAPNSYNVVVSSESSAKGSVTGGGEYDYLESVTITATPEMGYSFLGWYDGVTQVSTQATYTFAMPSSSLNYVAKFSTNSYSLTVTSENTNKGTVTGSGTYPYLQSRSITATAKTGYSFIGWYDGETQVSSSTPYTFPMPYNNLSYVAKFSTNSYVLTLTSNDINKGIVTGGGTYLYGSEVTATASEMSGNEFIGWYQSTTLKSTNLIYTFTMPYNALSLEARFVTQYNVDISSISDPSMGTVTGGGAYGYTTSVTITAIPANGYSFVAWYDDSFNVVSENSSYTFSMPENDLTFFAEFLQEPNVIVQSNDQMLGTVTGGGIYSLGDTVTITATPTEGNWFVAWHDDYYNVVSEVPIYTFTMPNNIVVYHAEFSATEPLEKGDTYQFGEYPQSEVIDIALISTLNTLSGALPSSSKSQAWTSYGYYMSGSVSSYMWYIDLINQNNKYRGVYFTSYRPYETNGTLTSNQNGYSTSTVYWFKFEPITWRILNVLNDRALFFADLALDSQDFHYSQSLRWIDGGYAYPNNYITSHIHSWLNNNFYNTAFSTEEKTRILGPVSSSYGKIFLLSYAHVTNSVYGFNSQANYYDPSRKLQSSAYAQSQGVYKNSSTGNVQWWLQSPGTSEPNYYKAKFVDTNGYLAGDARVTLTNYGIIPALWISL